MARIDYRRVGQSGVRLASKLEGYFAAAQPQLPIVVLEWNHVGRTDDQALVNDEVRPCLNFVCRSTAGLEGGADITQRTVGMGRVAALPDLLDTSIEVLDSTPDSQIDHPTVPRRSR